MKRKLKKWNGRVHGHKYEGNGLSVMAYSQKQCAELVSLACFNLHGCVGISEIRNYYSPCWGNDMIDILIDEPCVFLTSYGKNPLRIL